MGAIGAALFNSQAVHLMRSSSMSRTSSRAHWARRRSPNQPTKQGAGGRAGSPRSEESTHATKHRALQTLGALRGDAVSVSVAPRINVGDFLGTRRTKLRKTVEDLVDGQR